METPTPSPAGSPSPSSVIPAPAPQAGQPAPAADLTAGGGSSSLIVDAITEVRKTLNLLTSSHFATSSTLVEKLNRANASLATLATPQNEAATEVVLDALTKPGNRTTEFWLTLLGAIGTLCMAAGGLVSGNTAVWFLLVGTLCYTASRFGIKGKAADLATASLKLLLVGFCLSTLTGCAWIAAHKAQINATASVIGNRALVVAEQTLLSAAVSEADAGFKADYLDAIASGLRANEADIVTSADVAKIVQIWSPNDGAQWQKLAGGVAQIADQGLTARGDTQAAAVVEQIATGLNAAAANTRSTVAAANGVPAGPLTSGTAQ